MFVAGLAAISGELIDTAETIDPRQRVALDTRTVRDWR
jgi:hypothetical protein